MLSLKQLLTRCLCMLLLLALLVGSVSATVMEPETSSTETAETTPETVEPAELAGMLVGNEPLPEKELPDFRYILSEETDVMKSMQGNSRAAGFDIYIGGATTTSDRNASGNGWHYTASTQTLVLNNYVGGSIAIFGSITIQSHGEVTITGNPQGTGGAIPGIYVQGTLNLRVYDGALTVYGGYGGSSPAEGIMCTSCSIVCDADASLFAQGGPTYSSRVASGAGLLAENISLSGDGYMYIAGGSTSYGYGGSGLVAQKSLYVNVDCVIVGGSDNVSFGAGINLGGYCYLGCYEITIYGDPVIFGGSGASLQISSDAEYNISNNDMMLSVKPKPKSYTLRLDGAGGTLGGKSVVSLTNPYPATYALSTYLFTRSGYVQTGWILGDTTYPLSVVATPTENVTISAAWTKVQPGDLVLQGLWGTFPNGKNVHIISNGATEALPSELNYDQGLLLGWSNIPVSREGDGHKMSGTWFRNGTEVSNTSSSDVAVLYGQNITSGQYLRFHANGTFTTDGGNMLVYGSTEAENKVAIRMPGPDQLVVPEDYTFEGWAYTPDGEPEFFAGESAYMKPGYYIDLYAIWKPTETSVELDNGMTLTLISALNKLRISGPTDAVYCYFAAYEDSGRLGMVKNVPIKDGQAYLELDLYEYQGETVGAIKVFTMNKDYTPIEDCVRIGDN